MLVLIAKIIAALSAYGRTSEMAFSMALGFSFAMLPGGNLLWFLLFFILMILPLNRIGILSVLALTRLYVFFFDSLIEQFGYYLLTRPQMLKPMTAILSVPGLEWLRLNDSFIFGALALAILLLPVGFLVFFGLVSAYRKWIAWRINALFSILGRKIPLLNKLIPLVSSFKGEGIL